MIRKIEGGFIIASENKKYTTGIFFKATPEDIRLIEEKMKLAGIRNRSAYIRKMCIDGYIINLQIPELKEISSALARTGNNMNQIARRLNSGEGVYPDDFAEAKAQFEAVRGEFGRILAQLSKIK